MNIIEKIVITQNFNSFNFLILLKFTYRKRKQALKKASELIGIIL